MGSVPSGPVGQNSHQLKKLVLIVLFKKVSPDVKKNLEAAAGLQDNFT